MLIQDQVAVFQWLLYMVGLGWHGE
jgi:hypothetical protein